MKRVGLIIMIMLLTMGLSSLTHANLLENGDFSLWDGEYLPNSDFGFWVASTPNPIGATSDYISAPVAVFLPNGSGVKQSFIFPEAGTYEYGAWFMLYTESLDNWDQAGITISISVPTIEHIATAYTLDSIDLQPLWHPGVWPNTYMTDYFLISGTIDVSQAGPALFNVYLIDNRTGYPYNSSSRVDDAYVKSVPEPAILLLLGPGLLGAGLFGLVRMRRKLKK